MEGGPGRGGRQRSIRDGQWAIGATALLCGRQRTDGASSGVVVIEVGVQLGRPVRACPDWEAGSARDIDD